MARKKRSRQDKLSAVPKDGGGPTPAGAAQPLAAAGTADDRPRLATATGRPALPAEAGGTGTVAVLALIMFLAPAVGVPHEEMLQDTLKSIVVSFAALGAALSFFWRQRDRRDPLRWHAVVWLPLLLMAYALGSMAWSHTYLAGVEAIRWFLFSLLVWLGANSLARERLPMLAWGVHFGAVVAALWAALQFWVDFRFFPQGPHPASTFVNRNFFAEFAVCTLPFSAMLLARARRSAYIALLAAMSALVIVAIMMTGTRAALIALWVQLLLVFPAIAWLYRKQLPFGTWGWRSRLVAAGVLVGAVVGLGLIETGDATIAQEGRGQNALERGFKRTGSISANDPSLGIRMIMWKATGRVIQQRPLAGVGAGAWESEIPLFQAEGSQLETDYYVHNEYLQLLAEYGLAGWVFLLGLFAWLLASAWRTLRGTSAAAQAEAPWRAVVLCSLLALLIVSNVGFPWRMASTGALFALCLAALAASDARLGLGGRLAAAPAAWRPSFSRALAVLALAGIALAAYITHYAAESEQKLVRATKIALTISASGEPNNPKWNKAKAEMLTLVREGVAINPHYRKVTPMVADELAKWGDWKNATWIWESVLSSRPHVVAIITNVARGYASMGNTAEALANLERARKIQPRAPAVRSLEVILLSRTGQEARALELARQAIADNIYDVDLANATFVLGWRAGDFALAAEAIRLRMIGWPETRMDGYLQLGDMYALAAKDPVRALDAFKQALALAPLAQRPALLQRIPAAYRAKLGYPDAAPQAPAAQTSASKG
ncbi:MAG TPA: O-antigen ligase family protein [Ramlibacter sp.]|nr:O-antigen ligase family protein [Ramlibacter sp.]